MKTVFKKTLDLEIYKAQTILLCPAVQLLPQVDYLNAKALLTVRPLQVKAQQ